MLRLEGGKREKFESCTIYTSPVLLGVLFQPGKMHLCALNVS